MRAIGAKAPPPSRFRLCQTGVTWNGRTARSRRARRAAAPRVVDDVTQDGRARAGGAGRERGDLEAEPERVPRDRRDRQRVAVQERARRGVAPRRQRAVAEEERLDRAAARVDLERTVRAEEGLPRVSVGGDERPRRRLAEQVPRVGAARRRARERGGVARGRRGDVDRHARRPDDTDLRRSGEGEAQEAPVGVGGAEPPARRAARRRRGERPPGRAVVRAEQAARGRLVAREVDGEPAALAARAEVELEPGLGIRGIGAPRARRIRRERAARFAARTLARRAGRLRDRRRRLRRARLEPERLDRERPARARARDGDLDGLDAARLAAARRTPCKREARAPEREIDRARLRHETREPPPPDVGAARADELQLQLDRRRLPAHAEPRDPVLGQLGVDRAPRDREAARPAELEREGERAALARDRGARAGGRVGAPVAGCRPVREDHDVAERRQSRPSMAAGRARCEPRGGRPR